MNRKRKAATVRAWEAEYHQVVGELLDTLERLQADPYAPTDPATEDCLDQLSDLAHELAARIHAEDPPLVKAVASDRKLMRSFWRNPQRQSPQERQLIASLKDLHVRMEQATPQQLPPLSAEMTGLLAELRKELDRPRPEIGPPAG